MNSVCLVGRLVDEPKTIDNKTMMTIAVTRNFKNVDFIQCILWNNIASTVPDYCHKNDVVGVRGRLQGNNDKLEFIAEKVTFLEGRKEHDK